MSALVSISLKIPADDLARIDAAAGGNRSGFMRDAALARIGAEEGGRTAAGERAALALALLTLAKEVIAEEMSGPAAAARVLGLATSLMGGEGGADGGA